VSSKSWSNDGGCGRLARARARVRVQALVRDLEFAGKVQAAVYSKK
jgi:hypothetical protein